MISMDMADSGAREFYVDHVAGTSQNWYSYTNDSIGLGSGGYVRIGAGHLVANDPMDGRIGFVYLSDELTDFSDEAERLKFIDAFGYPVDLGADGSTPSGNQPLVYMNSGFHLGTNLGSGGNFTPISAPDDGGHVKG
jgi:hypothetical protein